MFTKIKKIKNIGSFEDFSTIIDLEKNNIIYALNGHWKSTLASILYSIKNNDIKHLIWRKRLWSTWNIECTFDKGWKCYKIESNKWKKNWVDVTDIDENIIIFDDDFINQNFFSEKFEIEHKRNLHRIIFWEEWIRLNYELNKLQEDIKIKRVELAILESKFSNLPKGGLSKYISTDISKLDKSILAENKEEIEEEIKNVEQQEHIIKKEELKKLIPLLYELEDIKNVFHKSNINWEAHEIAKQKVAEYKKEFFLMIDIMIFL